MTKVTESLNGLSDVSVSRENVPAAPQTKTPKTILPSPLKSKMDEYDSKMKQVRENIRTKRLAHGLTCHQCGRSYCRPYNLKRHIQYECGKAPQFPCLYCSYRARHKHDLKKHVTFKHSAYVDHFQQALHDGLVKEANKSGKRPSDKVNIENNLNELQSGSDSYDSFGKMRTFKATAKENVNAGTIMALDVSDYRADSNLLKSYTSNFRGRGSGAENSSPMGAFMKDSGLDLKVRSKDEECPVGPIDFAKPANGIFADQSAIEERIRKDAMDRSFSQSFNGDGDSIRKKRDSEGSVNGENGHEGDSHNESSDADEDTISNSPRVPEIPNMNQYNPYLAALAAYQTNNNEFLANMMTKMHDPLMFQQNLNRLIVMNRYQAMNEAWSS